jgi:hypothetical protein
MSADGPDHTDVPAFSGEDIVRLFAATYLPLCRSLEAAGALDPKALSRDIRARIAPDQGEAWAILAAALCKVLGEETAG